MGGFGDLPATSLQRLARALRAQIADYLDLAPAPADDGAVAKAIDDLQEKLGRLIAARRRLEKERAALAAAPAEEASRAEQALALGRDDLARAALRQRATLDARSADLENELDALGREAARIEAMIENSAKPLQQRVLRLQLEELDRLLADITPRKEA